VPLAGGDGSCFFLLGLEMQLQKGELGYFAQPITTAPYVIINNDRYNNDVTTSVKSRADKRTCYWGKQSETLRAPHPIHLTHRNKLYL